MGLFGKIGALIAQVLNNEAARGLAMKYFLKTLIITLVPLACLMAVNLILGEIISWIIGKVDGVSVSNFSAVQLSGMAAYLYVQLGLDVALGAILAGFSTKFVLRSIPFIKL